MNVREAMTQIRQKINDRDEIELTEEELLMYINEALQYVSSYLIQANSPMMLHRMNIVAEALDVNGEISLPENFVKMAGTYPVCVTGNKMKLLDDPPLRNFRYFSTCQLVDIDNNLPFDHDALNQIAVRLAAIYAGNQIEADISQDKALLDEVNAALAQVIGEVKA